MPRKTKMNSITSPELLAKVNPNNMQLKLDFLDYLKSTGKSPGTLAGYSNDLDIFFVWVMQNLNNKDFINVTKRELVRFQNWLLTENGNSSSRVRRIKSAISSMSNFIEVILDSEDEFKGFHSIIRKIESPPNNPVREKTVLSERQVEELMQSLTDDGKYDKACAVALAMYSGRRKSELLRFRVSDFADDKLVCNGALYKSSPIETKGKKMLHCFTLAKKFQPYFDRWMEYRQQHDINSEWLFPDKEDQTKQMPVSTMNSWASTFSNILGVDFYWHCMRHAAVTTLVRAGIPDSVVQQYIGWSDISMVPVYVDIDADEQLSMYFSGDGIITPEKKTLGDL